MAEMSVASSTACCARRRTLRAPARSCAERRTRPPDAPAGSSLIRKRATAETKKLAPSMTKAGRARTLRSLRRHGRSDEARHLPAQRAGQCVGLGQVVLRQQVRDDGGRGRVEEGATYADQEHGDGHVPQLEHPCDRQQAHRAIARPRRMSAPIFSRRRSYRSDSAPPMRMKTTSGSVAAMLTKASAAGSLLIR